MGTKAKIMVLISAPLNASRGPSATARTSACDRVPKQIGGDRNPYEPDEIAENDAGTDDEPAAYERMARRKAP